ncbi:hypothetical protein FSP39_005817 [Pinctada imbricata]|uniref:Reelin domain-containing protein n=1 Tax=Pinctada imbricata TaxID=66713 RepID=A0AA89C0L8_PINIB|nr:hypothetical protein FSP39_005817 [Pinctada imbricata]
MEKQSLASFLMTVCFIGHVTSYSSGPPLSVCQSMIPGHMVPAQTTPPPYSIMLNASSYMPGDVIEGKEHHGYKKASECIYELLFIPLVKSLITSSTDILLELPFACDIISRFQM